VDPIQHRRARAFLALAFLSLCSATPARLAAQTVTPPAVIGQLVGPWPTPTPPGLRLYGTDLGWTFEHRGVLIALFGDTWPYARFLCDTQPFNDDTQATLPLEPPAAGAPVPAFVTRAGAPGEYAPIVLRRGTESLDLGFGKTPLTGFSDGVDAFGVFGRADLVRCTRRPPRRKPSCLPHAHLTCAADVGECTPPTLGLATPCDLLHRTGCLPGSTCQPSPGGGLCVDPTSSQNDGTIGGRLAAVAHNIHVGVQDPARPVEYELAALLPTNKFINVTARTVRCFSGRTCGGDYRSGHGAVLFWGRPGFTAERGRQAQLYLMVHRLPFLRKRSGAIRLRPWYFAGLAGATGEPVWSRHESHAVPLALDGVVGGSPREEQPIVDQMAISWVGEPVSKWVMLYGGDLADYLLQDPAGARPGPEPGAVRIRFADHPWGPWTAALPHLLPGSASVVGDPYGPGGVLHHSACVDQGAARCAPSDPTRPPDVFLPGCASVGALFDNGRFYAPNIIDTYTRRRAGGADLFWNVSTWNPYGVVLMRTAIEAGSPVPPSPCGRAHSSPRSGAAGRVSRFRWCAAGE
jgi:hypothetical protein